jgi:biotin transporter BioY
MIVRQSSHLIFLVLLLGIIAGYVLGAIWISKVAPRNNQNTALFVILYLFFPVIMLIAMLVIDSQRPKGPTYYPPAPQQ